MIFSKVPICHQCLFKILYRWVISCNERQQKKKPEKKSGLLLSNCLNWKIYCDDHSSLSPTTAIQNELFHILHIIPLLTGDMNSIELTSLPMYGFIAQLVEQRTGNVEVTDSNPVEALIFFRLLLSNCLN